MTESSTPARMRTNDFIRHIIPFRRNALAVALAFVAATYSLFNSGFAMAQAANGGDATPFGPGAGGTGVNGAGSGGQGGFADPGSNSGGGGGAGGSSGAGGIGGVGLSHNDGAVGGDVGSIGAAILANTTGLPGSGGLDTKGAFNGGGGGGGGGVGVGGGGGWVVG